MAKHKSLSTLEIRRLLNSIEQQRAIIIVARDKLRIHSDELSDLLASLDGATEAIANGKREIENGLDELSQYL